MDNNDNEISGLFKQPNVHINSNQRHIVISVIFNKFDNNLLINTMYIVY